MANTEERLITWQNFERTYVSDGHANLVRAPGSPLVEFYVGEGASRIGLRTPCSDIRPIERLRLSQITVHKVIIGGQEWLDLSTQSEALFRQFFGLLRDIADRLQVEKHDVAQAVTGAVQDMRALASAEGLMSREAQHGLFGELLVLKRLVSGGAASLDAWTGPGKDPHDFRVRGVDIEVKTRVSSRRIHKIHDVGQLRPTAGRRLYIVSILLCPSPDGITLPELVASSRSVLEPRDQGAFDERVASYGTPGRGYREEDASHYDERLSLREQFRMIPVDSSVPAITAEALSELLGRDVASRVQRVAYDVNFEGLGFEDGSSSFIEIMPREVRDRG